LLIGLPFLTAVLQPGCEKKEKLRLLLEIRSVEPVESFDLVVAESRTGEVLVERRGVALEPELDLTEQSLNLQLDFTRRGRYVVFIAGHGQGRADQVYAERISIKGVVERSVVLVSLDTVDGDGDGFVDEQDCGALLEQGADVCLADCDDTDGSVSPLAAEVCGDEIDQNCDGSDLECRDRDGDGWAEDEDCDDQDPDRHPGRVERPNGCPTEDHPDPVEEPLCGDGIDQDCDGVDMPCQPDEDCDGWVAAEDCDDHDERVHPGGVELCNDPSGVDEDCDGMTDEGCVPCDLDGDGFQRQDASRGCPDADYLASGLDVDCDDLDSGAFPGLTDGFKACGGLEGGSPGCGTLRLCDGKDNDCDGQTDEGCATAEGLPLVCDQDGDGFLNPDELGCDPPAGLADCDDNDARVFPGAADVCGDGVLQNCSFETDCSEDADGDGYIRSVDCDDGDPAIAPWEKEVCDGKDNDCDGVTDEGNPDPDGNPLPASSFCTDDNDGICGVPQNQGGPMQGEYCNPGYVGSNPDCQTPPTTGNGRCVCSPVDPETARDGENRVACPGEDLAARASPRCFFAPQPEARDVCGGGVDEDCDPQTSDGAGDCTGDTPDCCSELGLCVDTQTDPGHCGSCGQSCDPTIANRCEGGECVCGTGPACAPGQECRSTGPTEEEAACACGPATCPNGCCLDTQCIPLSGQDDTLCGAGGESCTDCQADGLDCNGTGQCVCVAGGNCGGCCDGNFCRTGTGPAADDHCGINGVACTSCSAQGLDCNGDGMCVCVAGGNCTGCCDGNICRPGDLHTRCGAGGASCEICGTCEVCGPTSSCEHAAAGTDPRDQCAAEPESTCGYTGSCDGQGACEYWPEGTVCSLGLCVGSVYYYQDTCSPQHQCADGGSVDCAPYLCDATGCRATCATAADCVSGHYCAGGSCAAKKPLGDICGGNVECTSGHCVDGYCCDSGCTGVCEACDISGNLGTCSSHPAATDPEDDCPAEPPCGLTGQCDGNRACAYWPAGTVCNGSQCVGSVFYHDDTCTTFHVCADGGLIDCVPYACDASGCLTSCTAHTDCAAGHYCSSGSCLPEKLQGDTCAEDFECASGHCTDGYCCDAACDGVCEACDVGPSEGTCVLHQANTDPDGECAGSCQSCDGNGACHDTATGLDPEDECAQESPCGLDGECDGAGACGHWDSGTVCTAAYCDGSTLHDADTCDTSHACVDGGTQDCTPYTCESAACLTSCIDNTDCAAGYTCDATSSSCL
jgi:hypothetical protein